MGIHLGVDTYKYPIEHSTIRCPECGLSHDLKVTLEYHLLRILNVPSLISGKKYFVSCGNCHYEGRIKSIIAEKALGYIPTRKWHRFGGIYVLFLTLSGTFWLAMFLAARWSFSITFNPIVASTCLAGFVIPTVLTMLILFADRIRLGAPG